MWCAAQVDHGEGAGSGGGLEALTVYNEEDDDEEYTLDGLALGADEQRGEKMVDDGAYCPGGAAFQTPVGHAAAGSWR